MYRLEALRVTLKDAIASSALDSHRYLVNVVEDHCYGKTAHGGLLVSMIITAIQQHFGTTLKLCDPPDTFNIDTVFLRFAVTGKASVVLEYTKLGSNVSVIHLSLLRNNTERIVGYAMSVDPWRFYILPPLRRYRNTNLESEEGISRPTPSPLTPEIAPVDIAELNDDKDPHWATRCPGIQTAFPSQLRTFDSILQLWPCRKGILRTYG